MVFLIFTYTEIYVNAALLKHSLITFSLIWLRIFHIAFSNNMRIVYHQIKGLQSGNLKSTCFCTQKLSIHENSFAAKIKV
jgi:hypothetical protein